MLLMGSKEDEQGHLAKRTWDLSFTFCNPYFATLLPLLTVLPGSQNKALRIWLRFIGPPIHFAKFACGDQFIYGDSLFLSLLSVAADCPKSGVDPVRFQY